MLKTIFFDCDGVVVANQRWFSEKFAVEFNIPKAKLKPFFENEFLLCKLGKADLKQELKKYLPAWGWKKSTDELLKYWFTHESTADKQVIDYIQSLRAQDIQCYMTTNNEKYRSEYLYYHLALSTLFDDFISSYRLGCLKNQTEFWQQAYKFDMGNKREILVVDDDPAVIATARKFGFFGHHYSSLEGLQAQVENLLKV